MAKRNGDTRKLIMEATIDVPPDALNSVVDGWDIEQVLYANRWSWVCRHDEVDEITGEVREVSTARPLVGWAHIRHRETGKTAHIGMTADAESGHVYPAPQAEGFTGYVHESEAKPGDYVE